MKNWEMTGVNKLYFLTFVDIECLLKLKVVSKYLATSDMKLFWKVISWITYYPTTPSNLIGIRVTVNSNCLN